MSEFEVPKATPKDAAHSLTKAALASIPVIGGAATELFQQVVQPPLVKRQLEWMERIGTAIETLQAQGFTAADLQENEQFTSAVMTASRLALQTHQEEKLQALRNAIVNIATGVEPDETKQYMFFNYIESLTAQHIQILAVARAPKAPPGISMGGLGRVLEHNLPRMQGQRTLYDQLWQDLHTKGLVNTNSLHTTMTRQGLETNRLTPLGESFLAFISSDTRSDDSQ